MQKLIFPILAALFCIAGSMGCKKPKSPDYIDFANIRVKKADKSETVLGVDLKFFNPNNFGMQVKKADFDIYFNEKYVGHSTMDSVIQISKLDTFYLPIELKLQLKDLFKNALQILMNPEVMVKVQGNARIEKGGFSINYPINYEGKQRIDQLLKDTNLIRQIY